MAGADTFEQTPAKRGRSAKKADSEVNGGAEEDEHDKEEHTPVPKRAKTPVNSKVCMVVLRHRFQRRAYQGGRLGTRHVKTDSRFQRYLLTNLLLLQKMTNGVKPEPSADAESDDDADYLI